MSAPGLDPGLDKSTGKDVMWQTVKMWTWTCAVALAMNSLQSPHQEVMSLARMWRKGSSYALKWDEV